MRSRVIGLDIGSCGVRAAQLSFSRSGVTLERVGQVALPEGAVRDGEVVNAVAVAEAVRQLWTSVRFSTKEVVLGVANHRVIVRQVDVPFVPLADIPAALPFQVQDLLPMPVDQAVLDFFPLTEVTDGDGQRMHRGLLVAASRDMVMANVRCVESAGLVPTSVDLTPFAVLRSLGSRLDVDVQAEALVDIGAQVTNIVIHVAGVPRFVRILLRGGQEITDAVSEGLGVDPDEARELKHTSSLMGVDQGLGDAVARVVADGAQALIDELRGSLDYYAASHPGDAVERVVLSGGGAMLTGFAERLSEATRLPVVMGAPLASLDTTRVDMDDDALLGLAPLIAVPVGLAMGGTR